MKNNPLDDIVKCSINISNPPSNDTAFDSIILVVPGPSGKGKKSIGRTVSVGKADELLGYGFAEVDPAYKAALIAFSQNPAPVELNICVRKKEEGSEAYEPIGTTLARANAESPFYGIHITAFREPDDVNAVAAWAEANEKLFAFEYDDYENCPVSKSSCYRSFGIFSGKPEGYLDNEKPEENDYLALAWMAKCFGYEPGTETWHMKELAMAVPSVLDAEQKKNLGEKHINTFLRYAGSNITIGGYTLAGEWIDVIRFRDWLKAEMQTNVFNALKVNKKVPFTDHGIGMIQGKMEETLKKGQDIGGIAPTEYDKDSNKIPGYTVTVPKAASLTEAERKSRKLTGCRYTARLSGAIHAVEIEGFLTF